MKPRKRITFLAKFIALSCALLIDLAHAGFALLAVVPFIGILGSMGNFGLAVMSFMGFGTWFITVPHGAERLIAWLGTTLGILGLQILATSVPFVGGFVGFLMALIVTLRIYVAIKLIEREDKAYNKEHGLI